MIVEQSIDQVNRYVDERREDLVALCARLVEAESVNPPGETTPYGRSDDFAVPR